MKFIKYCLFLLFAISLYSCPGHVPNYHYYKKAFFLGDDNIHIDGTVFNNSDYFNNEHPTPRNFARIFARAKNVTGWEIEGANKGNSKFEFIITTTANGVTISNETIVADYPRLDRRITEIEFYLDNENFYCFAHHNEGRHSKYGFNYSSYYYAYATEAMDLSETYTVEGDSPWKHIDTHHNDLNFSKPGWYKIVSYDDPINNNQKYYSGKNTELER